jgi:hypothetical protein
MARADSLDLIQDDGVCSYTGAKKYLVHTTEDSAKIRVQPKCEDSTDNVFLWVPLQDGVFLSNDEAVALGLALIKCANEMRGKKND